MKKNTVLFFVIISTFINVKAQKNILKLCSDSASNYIDLVSIIESDSTYLKNSSNAEVKRYHRMRYFMDTRIDKQGTLETYHRNMISKFNNKKSIRSSNENIWKNVDYRLSGRQGRMQSVWVSKTNPDYILAGAATGGLWKCTNATYGDFQSSQEVVSFECITDGQNGVPGGIFDIAVPDGNENVIYVATCVYATELLAHGSYSYGIYKSMDGGINWTAKNNNLDYDNVGDPIVAIEIDQSNQNIIYAVSLKRIYKSTDGGDNWSDITPSWRTQYPYLSQSDTMDFLDIDIHPNPDSTSTVVFSGKYVAAITYNGGNNIYKLNNQNINNPFRYIALEFEKASPYNLFAIYEEKNSQSGYNENLYNRINNQWQNVYTNNHWDLTNYSWLPLCFVLTEANTFYLGIKEAKILFNYPQNPRWAGGYTTHVDVRDAAFYTDAVSQIDYVYVANDGGMTRAEFSLDPNTPFKKIHFIDKNLLVKQHFSFDIAKLDPNLILTGSIDNGTDFNENGNWRNIDGNDGGRCLIHEGNNHIFFTRADGTSLHDLRRREIGTLNESTVSEYYKLDLPLIKHPSLSNVMYSARMHPVDTWKSILKISTNSGSTFLTNEAIIEGTITDIAICENYPDNMYASSFYYPTGTFGTFYRKNAASGYAWQKNSNVPTDSLLNIIQTCQITDIEVHPDNPDKLWLTIGQFENNVKILCSSNGGTNWFNVTDNLDNQYSNIPVNKIIYYKEYNALFVGRDDGVYYNPQGDGDPKWYPFGTNLPFVPITEMKISSEHELLVSTWGRGIYKIRLDCEELNIPQSIKTTTTWSSDAIKFNEIIIPNGNILTISNCTIRFAPCAKIIIEPGGRLIIDNATLTSLSDRFWDGIIVRGNRNDIQHPLVQGLLTMQDATIENARIGVQLSDQWDKNGGIIYANNCTFKNCRKAVEFLSYTEEKSISYFKECTFECTGPLSDEMYEGSGISHFVTIWQVDGIQFLGNTFRNIADYTDLPGGERGTGIGSIEAAYEVMKTDDPGTTFMPCNYPDGIPNQFFDLDVAIYNGINYSNSKVRVRENEFINCAIAMQIDEDFDFLAYKNELKYGTAPAFYPHTQPDNIKLIDPIGISTSESQQINLIENDILFDLESAPIEIQSNWSGLPVSDLYVGIYTNQTYEAPNNYDSKIYSNTQTDGLFSHIGQYIAGNNTNLQITCNTYNNLNYFDWYLEELSYLQEQATSGADARNNFNGTTCGGAGIPYNKINNQETSNLFNYYSNPTLTFGCYNNVNPLIPITSPGTCMNSDLCDIYPDFNGDQSWIPGENHKNENTVELTGRRITDILSYIYSRQFEEANAMINDLTNSKDVEESMITFLNTVKGIYKSGRQYTEMNTSEESIFANLAENYNTAGYYSQHILNTFREYRFDHTPLQFKTISGKESGEDFVSLEQNESQTTMNIYPNPANDEFTIELVLSRDVQHVTLSIVDITGKVVYDKEIESGTNQIKLRKSDLGNTGTYQCILSINNQEQNVKRILIIE